MVVKEYKSEKTKIRIHNDFIKEDTDKKTKELIISLMINFLENNANI